MKHVLFLVFFCSINLINAQFNIKGIVQDEEQESLVGATVVLLDQDSTMVAFSLTNSKGEFILEDIDSSAYILQATFISFSNYSAPLNLAWDRKEIEIPPIHLKVSSEVLQEITIKAEHIPMGLNGDTISYNAAAFKTRPNATVEDLLKKLPGIEVDRNGSIKAQGEDVENVLVDGKEFFGKDPKMATKNLEAEAIDKVEVYDKKSDIAEFTGVDDGDEEKTINLKLKEDHKKGGFGNANLAGGTSETYDSKFNYFRFTPSLQASIIFAANNINKETFTINDRIDFMGGMMNAMAGGVLNLSGMRRMQDGLNTSLSAGTNLNYDFSPKVQLLSHYLLNQTGNDLIKESRISSFTDAFDYSNNDLLESNYHNRNHQINTKLTFKHNPFLEFILRNNFNWTEESTNRLINSNYLKNEIDQGFSSSNLGSLEEDWELDSHTLIKKKFRKKGRSLISNVNLRSAKDVSDDIILNKNRIGDNVFDIDQTQTYNNKIRQIGFSSNYTEPISKNLFLGLNYKYGISNEKPFRDFFDNIDGESIFNDKLSSDYQKTYEFQLAGFSLKRNIAKLKLEANLQVQFTRLQGIINGEEQSIIGNYRNVLPAFKAEYDFKGSGSINARYGTRISPPELEQLLPLPNNTNANFQYIGNPSLRPSYVHSFNTSYNYFDNFSFTNFWVSIRLNNTKNRIVTKSNIDENLFRTIQPINVDKYWSANIFTNFSRPLKPLKINYKIRLTSSIAVYESFINDVKSDVVDNNYNLRFSINNRKTKYFDLETGVTIDYYTKKYGINPDFNSNFFNTDLFLSTEFYLPKAWIIGTDLNYISYSNASFSTNTSYSLLGAKISKYFLDNKLEINMSAHDILNQNIGIRRSSSINSLREDNFNNLSRYFMLGINYKIGKGKKRGISIEAD